METLTFQLPADRAGKLADEARELGVAMDDLLRQITDEYLARREKFRSAARYVLDKNAELYRRLAQ